MPLRHGGDWPRVSIVTINYNGRDHLADCFASIRALRYPADRLEILCIDNDSSDGSPDYIRREHPDVRLIESGSNLGFAAGCNLGARESRAELIAFLNNDARVDPGWLEALVEALDPDSGLICSAAVMLDWQGEQVDFVEGHLSFHGFARQAHWRARYKPEDFSEAKELLFACGGAMLIDRRVFLEVGGFDERFWMFFEDVDLGWRLWILGYRVVLAPGAITYHRHHGSAGRLGSDRRNFLYERNGLMMILKNYADETLQGALPAAIALMAHRATDYLQRSAGGFDMLEPETWCALDEQNMQQRISLGDLAPLVALRAVLERLPDVMAERERIQAGRRRPDPEILPLFGQPRRLYPMGHMLVQDYCEAHQHLWFALGLDRVFAGCSARVAVLSSVGLPGLGFPDSREGRRAEAIGLALRRAGHEVVHCLPERLIEAHPEAQVDTRTKRFAWNDRKLDNRLLRLGPDLIVATHWRCLAFARLSIYRPLVLDHDPSDPLPAFEAEVERLFESPKDRRHVQEALLRLDYLINVDRFLTADEAEQQALRRWLDEEADLRPPAERFALLPEAELEAEGGLSRVPAASDLPPGLAALDAFCRLGAYGRDKLAVDFRPPFPHTPAWELPIKAWRSLKTQGPGCLADEVSRYLRWIWHNLQRRMAR